VKVREALVADPRVLAADASLRDLAELLTRPNVRSVLVVDGDRLLGCASAQSVVAALARGDDPGGLLARDVATGEVTTITPDAPVGEAIRLMGERDLDRLAVVEGERFLGALPRDGLVRRLAEDEPPAEDDEPLGAI
jgi:CBS domain-containing protein